jgi:hypothetical protein
VVSEYIYSGEHGIRARLVFFSLFFSLSIYSGEHGIRARLAALKAASLLLLYCCLTAALLLMSLAGIGL